MRKLGPEQRKVLKEQHLNQWFPQKLFMAKEWIDTEQIQKARSIVQGSVHLCQLGENIGNEQSGERPVLIVSNNRINQTSGNVKVIPLTTKTKTKEVVRKGQKRTVPKMSSHFFLTKTDYPFLDATSAAKGEEVTTVSKMRLTAHLGNIEPKHMVSIKRILKWVYDL